MAVVLHEIGHALGLVHEHQAPERDQYIRILEENIQEDYRWVFNKYASAQSYGIPYDMSSLMHYSPHVSCRFIKKKKYICITFVQQWPNVFDVGPTLHKLNIPRMFFNTSRVYFLVGPHVRYLNQSPPKHIFFIAITSPDTLALLGLIIVQ